MVKTPQGPGPSQVQTKGREQFNEQCSAWRNDVAIDFTLIRLSSARTFVRSVRLGPSTLCPSIVAISCISLVRVTPQLLHT